MTIPFWCVLAAFAIIYLIKIPVSIAMHQLGGFNNKQPRDQQAALTGWGRRMTAAHYNSVEGFAPFAASVFVAHLGHGDPLRASQLSATFVVCRVLHPVLYALDIDKARSVVWFIGIACTVGLFLLPVLR